MTLVTLVVADPATPDALVESQRTALEASGAVVTLVDLRAFAPRPVAGSLPVRAVRALIAGWWASRGMDSDAAAQVDGAELVMAGDRFAVPGIWRRRRHSDAILVVGLPAALTVLGEGD